MKDRLILRKILLYSFTTILANVLLTTVLLASESTFGQKVLSVKQVNVDVSFNNDRMKAAFTKLELQSGYRFVYFENDLDNRVRIKGNYKQTPLYEILQDIGEKGSLNFKQVNKNITVKKASRNQKETQIEVLVGGEISGTITDEMGEPLAGATVLIKGTTNGVVTGIDGTYSIGGLEAGDYEIVVSFVGFQTQTFSVTVGEAAVTQDVSLPYDLLGLDEVIVTGNTNPKTKLESSVAITTMNSKELEQYSAASTANYLQAIPGFLVESSAGEVGNNLFARGIPSAGAYEYVQIQEDGLPVFEDGALQFANIDNFQRVDLTVGRLEAVRGGSASILSSGAPGGIINFQSKTGGNQFEGVTKLTVGDYGLLRTDMNVGGAIVKDQLFYNFGGFYRVDQGIRSPGYDANKGGQFKGNMTYQFDKGYARVNLKLLNDRNIFYQSTPFVMQGSEVKAYPGFDPNYGTMTSRNFSKLRVPQEGGSFFEKNLEDGVNPVSTAIGSEFGYDITDNISVKNAMKSTVIDLNYNAIFAAHWMGDVSTQDQVADANGIPVADAQFTYDDDGSTLDANTELKRADYWYIHKDMRNFANNMSFNFDYDAFNLNVGYYYSNWSSDQNWNWSSFLVTASDNPRLVNLLDTNDSTEYTLNGISAITWLQRYSQIKNTINAFYADAEFFLTDQLTAGVGLRYDDHQFNGVGDHGTWGNDIGIYPNNNADNGVNVLRGDYTYWSYDLNELSYSASMNYKMSDNMAAYVRYSHGFRTPIEESFYGPAVESGAGTAGLADLEPTYVDQAELGYKYSSPNLAIFANAFFMKLDNIAYQDIREGGVSEKKFANVQNIGLELEANAKFGDLSVNFNGTLQNPQYKGYEGENSALNGNLARRISKFYFTLRPSYTIAGRFNIYANYAYFGKKYQDIANTFELPAFGTLGAGASYSVDNVTFALDATNIFNVIGLTEADGRQDGVAPVDGQTFMGRAILGRAVKGSVLINF